MKTTAVFLGLLLAGAFSAVCYGQAGQFTAGLSASADRYVEPHESPYKAANLVRGSIGIGFTYMPCNRFVLKSGLLYSDKTTRLTPQPYDQTGPLLLTILQAEEITYKSSYLDVPLMAGYQVVRAGKFSVVPAAGVVSSFLLGSQRQVDFGNNEPIKTTTTSTNSKIMFAPAFELGLNYHVSDKVQLGVAPYCRAGLNINSWGPVGNSPSSFGVAADVRFVLGQ